MTGAPMPSEDIVPVASIFGRTLNMLWLVDAIELAIRRRAAWPLRMWWYFKTQA